MSSPRTNIMRCLRRQGYDYVPIDMDLCDSQRTAFHDHTGHNDYARHFGLCHRGIWVDANQTFTDGRLLHTRETLPADAWFDNWGIGHSKGSELAFHMTRMHHPLKGITSVEELRVYPYPRLGAEAQARANAEVARIHEQGLAAVGGLNCTVWERSWYLRSMEELMVDMMMGDEKAVFLLDKVTEVSCARAALYARAGIDILHLGDDIGTQAGPMLSVDMWAEWLKPRLVRVILAARAIKPDILVFYHSCGNVTDFIPGLIDAGVDILNPVQPECMSFDEVHRIYGERLSFWGTIGTQSTMPFGSPADVKREVTSKLTTCGPKGGVVIGPTHLVEPEVPWENITALVEAASTFQPGGPNG